MVIVYGTRKKLKTDKKLGYSICPNCNHNTERVLCREKIITHIFYIPIVVLTGKRGEVCPVCGMAKIYDKAQYKELIKA